MALPPHSGSVQVGIPLPSIGRIALGEILEVSVPKTNHLFTSSEAGVRIHLKHLTVPITSNTLRSKLFPSFSSSI